MSIKSVPREMRETTEETGNVLSGGIVDEKQMNSQNRSHIAPTDLAPSEVDEQGQWANLPPELLLDIIRRVDESEASWPARKVVVFCASVCRSWREITKEIVKTPEACGKLTFPISLKQPGPRDSPIQCFIKRDRETSVYRLYLGPSPSEDEIDKLLLSAKRLRRTTRAEFLISLATDDFSRASDSYVGKLRSNFLGTKFTIFDTQPSIDVLVQQQSRHCRRFQPRQVSPRLPACNYSVATILYELNVLRTRGPRRMHCVMHSIPASSIQEGGAPYYPSKAKTPGLKVPTVPIPLLGEPLILKNKAPRWHEQLQCWCLNFRGRVTVASVKNFQLVAAINPSLNVSVEEQEKVILQFGKIGKDIFTMDYHYPLSAFQAFAICLSSFDTKPACE